MSYDFSMADPESGATLGDSVNHTSNTGAMMERAMGQSLHGLYGKMGCEAAPILLEGAVRLFDERDHLAKEFEAMSAPNGWGNVHSTGLFLLRCGLLCAKFPTLKVWVGR